jgi:hypothetical protein
MKLFPHFLHFSSDLHQTRFRRSPQSFTEQLSFVKIGILRAMHYHKVYGNFYPYFPHLLSDVGEILYDTSQYTEARDSSVG